MKKIFIITALFMFVLTACEQQADNGKSLKSPHSLQQSKQTLAREGTTSSQFFTVDSETGYVDNFWHVNTAVNGLYPDSVLLAGKPEPGLTDYKAILSFDTSSLPHDAVITDVVLGVGLWLNLAYDTAQNQQYVDEHVYFEFANFNGFGGSYSLTGFDYYAFSPHSILRGDLERDFLLGYYHFLPETAWTFINRFGKTQIRISVPSNPENKLVHAFGYFTDSYRETPTLIVLWH